MWTLTERGTTIGLPPPSTPRLCLRPPPPSGSPQTLLDGGWWPRSADPAAELPGLALALQAHGPPDDHRPITHIMLRASDWDSHPRKLRVDGSDGARMVRLSWFDTLPAGLLTAIYADGRRVDLLTVPALTGHAEAYAAMELAALTANHLRTPGLLAALTMPTAPASARNPAGTQTASHSAWETEGGRLREHPAPR
ncbi:DUF5994 family protein [Actinomadura rugatobispora]|uniref:DUF5994 family protein n=1 Tax=Actinomadura rugatobispora TaxID=1994 RepID=A0ABW0ZZI1_9ACTN|nr:hypothetical protein GCM10010200_098960 [Actinomadura rugatobispora]